jgi:hypothetical protein
MDVHCKMPSSMSLTIVSRCSKSINCRHIIRAQILVDKYSFTKNTTGWFLHFPNLSGFQGDNVRGMLVIESVLLSR